MCSHASEALQRHVRKAWLSLDFYKEYVFGFETLILKTKENTKSHHMTPLKLQSINFFLIKNDPKSIFKKLHNQPVFKTAILF